MKTELAFPRAFPAPRPRSVEVRETPLPLSGAGKILKRELRKPFWEGQGRRVN